MYKIKHVGFLVIAIGSLLGACQAQSAGVPIPGFSLVSPGVYRSARPDASGLAAAAALGIKVDLDLENDDSAIETERSLATTSGMTFISMPMSGFWTPTDKEVDQILALVDAPANQPVLIHCLHGEDRTGLVVGLFRVFAEGWSPARAYQEMLDHGFHPLLFLLNHYYEEKTGYED